VTVRSPQLDLLRGIAVLMVIAFHYPYYHFLQQVGWAGVDLFFVLSGFLISGLLFSEWKRCGTISVRRFFVRRALKIYPGFYVFLLVTAAPAIHTHGIRRFWIELLFLQDYLPHLWGHTWSLAVEEHFYLLLPLILVLLSKSSSKSRDTGFRWIPAFSILLIACCFVMRVIAARIPTSIDKVVYPMHLRMDSLFAGVALGYMFHFRSDVFYRWSRWWLFILGLLLLVPLLLFGERFTTLSLVLTCNTLGFSVLLWWVMPRSIIRCQLIEKIGVYSYSIYVWHYFVIVLFRSHDKATFSTFWLALAACVACGFCAAQIVEFPVLKLRDMLVPEHAEKLPVRGTESVSHLPPEAGACAEVSTSHAVQYVCG
jgi:peptidoglycan/LPS O-acetylase OafA/YrhL